MTLEELSRSPCSPDVYSVIRSWDIEVAQLGEFCRALRSDRAEWVAKVNIFMCAARGQIYHDKCHLYELQDYVSPKTGGGD